MKKQNIILCEKTFSICTELVVKLLKPTEVSKPFKSGYIYDKNINYYIAVLNYSECKKIYNSLPEEQQILFSVIELEPGLIGVSKITLTGMNKNGIHREITHITCLAKDRHIAMILYNLSKKYDCSPIEFINKISKAKTTKK